MSSHQDILTDDETELVLRECLVRQQFISASPNGRSAMAIQLRTSGRKTAEHLARIAGLEQQGIAFAAGPFRDRSDPADRNGDGMFILRAESREQASAIANFPFHKSGLPATASCLGG